MNGMDTKRSYDSTISSLPAGSHSPPSVKVYIISAPTKVVNWKSLTHRWGGKRTKTYIQNLRPQPTIRWCLNHQRAKELQNRLENHIPDTPIHEAWEEFLKILVELGYTK